METTYLGFVNEKIFKYSYKVVLNNGEEKEFDKNDLKGVIAYLYEHRTQGEWVIAPAWTYEDKPDLRYYDDIYRDLMIENEKPYISAQGGFYLGNKEEDAGGNMVNYKLYVGNIFIYRPWGKYKDDKINQVQFQQRKLGYERFLP